VMVLFCVSIISTIRLLKAESFPITCMGPANFFTEEMDSGHDRIIIAGLPLSRP
jgi:hypothetical protein